jgi:hypothetical protein
VTEWIGAAIFVIGTIFTAGKIISAQRSATQQLKGDLNGIGRKVRKQHTRDLLLIAGTDSREERFRLVEILRED